MAKGAQLFSGQTALANGGPSCVMCHSAAQLGMANRGTVGPDLSTMYATLGTKGLEDMLDDHLPPTMAPIYGPHKLTATERDEIIAFLSAGKATAPAAPSPAPAHPKPQAVPPSAAAPSPSAPSSPADAGAQLFSGQVALHDGGPACTVCHSAAQLGFANRGTMGPDLSSAYARLGPAGLEELLTTHLPATMAPIFQHDPLTTAEQNELIAFFHTGAPAGATSAAAAAAPAPSAPPPPPPPTPAMIALGEHLFCGQVRFQNGGPACIDCHSAAGNPFPSGGGLGPDLTTIDTRIGAIGVDATLQTLFFPAMRPLYHGHSLTPQEQSALAAYFLSIAKQPPHRDTAAIAAWAFITLLILLGITAVLGRHHTAGVRRRMVEAAHRAPRRADRLAAAAARKGEA